MKQLRNFLINDDAATAVEYAVMLALILVAVISTIGVLGSQAGGLWGGIDTDLRANGFGQ
jgi:pilus assembly protein Flp/PilA